MLLLLLACGPKEGPPAPTPAAPAFDARPLWNQLASTHNSCSGQFDYFPNGGMLIFGCHVASVFSLEELEAASPHPIWAKGPHGAELDLDNPSDFGHYDPDFVRWAGDALIPAARSPSFREATQGIYDERVAPLARTMWLTRQKLEADPGCAQRELDLYVEHMDGGPSGSEWGAHYERWFFFHNANFCSPGGGEADHFDDGFDGGISGNVTKTCVGFWLRRELDGTADLWAANLHRLLSTYDGDWLG